MFSRSYGRALKCFFNCRLLLWFYICCLVCCCTIKDFIHLCLPPLPISRVNLFSFMIFICPQAFIMKNLCPFHDILTVFQSFMVIHSLTSDFTCNVYSDSFTLFQYILCLVIIIDISILIHFI